jgi:adenylate kinase
VQRPDDAEEVVRERLQVFARQTEPLVAHYRAGTAFFDVDGNQPVDRVAEAVRGVLRRVAEDGSGTGQST